MKTTTSSPRRACPVLLLAAAVLLPATLWAAAPHAKILIRADGMVAVTGALLQGAGVPLEQVAVDKLALTCQGEPVSFRLVGAVDGKLAPAAALIFYGQKLDQRWTDTNVYWLSWDKAAGPRMADRPLGDQALLTFFPARTRLEQNREYGYLIWPPETGELNPWFWGTAKVGKDLAVKFDLPGLVNTPGPVRLTVMLRGRTHNMRVKPDHHAVCKLGGKVLAEAKFDSQEPCQLTAEMPATDLTATGNGLTIHLPGDTEAKEVDQVYLDWIEVTYPRSLQAAGKQFAVTPDRPGKLQVTGWAGTEMEVYDVTNPLQPRCQTGLKVVGGQVGVGVNPGEKALQLVAADGYLAPAEVKAGGFPQLRSPEQAADYLILVHDDLLPAIQPLAQHRARGGMRVVTAPLSWVYDEFGGGVVSPHAIRRCLAYAYANWKRPAPKYVLLVGDASYDPRDYLGTKVRDLLPAYPVRLREGVETPCDHWYVCVDGEDQSADMTVGRLPASTPEQLTTMVNKTLAYEQQEIGGEWSRRVLCVADHELQSDDPGWFEQSIERCWKGLRPLGLEPTAHYLRLTKISRNMTAEQNKERVRTTATPAILKQWSEGVALVLFEGHGGATFWGRQHILDASDVAALQQPILPVVLEITCFSGQFDKPDVPGGQCFAEALLTAKGGAVATLTPSRLGGTQVYTEFLRHLVQGEDLRLGPLVRATRERYRGNGVYWSLADTYNLLGDPALVLRIAPVQKPPEVLAGEVVPPPSTPLTAPGRPFLGGPDLNANDLDDRLEKRIAELEKAGQADREVEVALLLKQEPTDDDLKLIQRHGGRVKARGHQPPALLVRVPANRAVAMAKALGGATLRFTRFGAQGMDAPVSTGPLPTRQPAPPQ